MEEHQFISVREAAGILGVSKRTIYRWLKGAKWFEWTKLPNGAIRISRVSVEVLLHPHYTVEQK